MIEITNLKKNYGSIEAVKGISFQVREGEIYGLLGPNGAGKSTTISMISGLLKPDAGSALIGGRNIWLEPKPVKRMIGVVPQENAIYEELSRFWKPFEASVVPTCPNPTCPNHQIAREQGDTRYHLFGRTKAGSIRYRCKA